MFSEDRGERAEERALAVGTVNLADEPKFFYIGSSGETVHRHLKIAELFSGFRMELAQELEFAQYFNSTIGNFKLMFR